MAFDIVTYCSENYADSLNFCLPGWIHKSGCENIIIYTDGKWLKPKIEVPDGVMVSFRPEFLSSTDWVENVGRQPISLLHYTFNAPEDRKFFFIGTDCMIIKNVSEWFRALTERNKIFGGVRVGPSGKFPTNHFFGINTVRMGDFVRCWAGLSEDLRRAKIMVTPGKQAYDQLSYMLMIGYNQEYKDDILPLDYMQVLSECDDVGKWEEDIRQRVEANVPLYGLHFKGGRWKDKPLVERILRAAGVRENEPEAASI